MKRGATRHPKINFLAERLKVDVPYAVGLLELLWHYTAEYYPAGDIGRASDKIIAGAVFWKKNPSLLIAALIEEKWLDRSGTDSRLLVHDWPIHADDAVHMKMARGHRYFADGTEPKQHRLTGTERIEIKSFYDNSRAHGVRWADGHLPVGQGKAGQGSSSSSIENIVEPPIPPLITEATEIGNKLTEPAARRKRRAYGSSESLPWKSPRQLACFEDFWKSYWRKVGKLTSAKIYIKLVLTEKAHTAIMAGIKNQQAMMLAREEEKRPHASTWLNGKHWEDEIGKVPTTDSTKYREWVDPYSDNTST